MTFQPTLESLIHRMELRHQHIEDELPEKERWGAGAYCNHELRLYERFLAELYALRDEQAKDKRAEITQDTAEKWIPVSERLPEDFEDVLVWYEYFRYGDYNRMFQTYGIGCYISNTGTWSGDPGTGTKVKVIAWQPLPEPYKAESEE